MAKLAFVSTIAKVREARAHNRLELKRIAGERMIRDAILKTFNTGSKEHLEVAYEKSCITVDSFYNTFRTTIETFKYRECSIAFLKSVLEFWERHGLASCQLECIYSKWLNYEWFTLIKDVEYRFFWNWMFENGMEKFNVSDLVENTDVKLVDIIERIASRNEYIDLIFNKHLDEFLNSIWEAVFLTEMLPIDEAISAIVHQFPNYETRVLNHAYYYTMSYFKKGIDPWVAKDFLYIIERMADYEYYTEKPIFSDGEAIIPKNNDGHVNLNLEVEKIISNCCDDESFKDIIWILENRFNVDNEYIEECMCRVFVKLCSLHSLSEIVCGRDYEYEAVLPAMLQFSCGYRIFMIFFEDMVRKSYVKEFTILEENYGLTLETTVKF